MNSCLFMFVCSIWTDRKPQIEHRNPLIRNELLYLLSIRLHARKRKKTHRPRSQRFGSALAPVCNLNDTEHLAATAVIPRKDDHPGNPQHCRVAPGLKRSHPVGMNENSPPLGRVSAFGSVCSPKTTANLAAILINTPLQRGAWGSGVGVNRFNGFHPVRETVKTVSRSHPGHHTPLKRGVNEIFPVKRGVMSFRSSDSCTMARNEICPAEAGGHETCQFPVLQSANIQTSLQPF